MNSVSSYHSFLAWQDTKSLMAVDMVEHLKKGIGSEGQVFFFTVINVSCF